MKKLNKIIVVLIIMVMFITVNSVNAVDKTKLEEYIKENKINASNVNASDVLTIYQDLSKEYTNKEMSELLDEYSEDLNQKGISNEDISKGKTILNSTDAETLNEVLEDVNVEDIKKKIDEGVSTEEIINDITDNMSTTKKVSTVGKIAFGNKMIKTCFIIYIVYIIIMVIIRGFVYKKAGEHYWATFIPFYRDIVLFRICGYSAGWILLLFLPIIGWIIYGILKIIMNFELSKAFGKNALFGACLWLLKPIFETLIAFSSKCRYIEIED